MYAREILVIINKSLLVYFVYLWIGNEVITRIRRTGKVKREWSKKLLIVTTNYKLRGSKNCQIFKLSDFSSYF